MNPVRRSVAGLAAAALTATGLSVLSVATAPSAHATAVQVDDATLRWGINTEVNSASFAPGTWNLLSAGRIGNPGAGGKTLTSGDDGATWSNGASAGWANQSGNVTVEDLQAGGGYAPTTFLGTRQNSAGVNGTTGNGINAETQLVFRHGTGTVDADANTASVQWDGDATVLFYSGMTFFHLADPELTVAADGTGTLTATVDGYAASMADPTQWNDLADEEVTLATLSGVDVDELGLTTTPAYHEVEYDAPAGATAQSRTGVNWGAFPQDFVDFQQLTGGSSYWYSSGSSADVRKPATPLQVTFDATPPAPPAVEVTDTELLPSGAHQVTVTGTGFDPALATGTRPPLSGKAGGTYVVFGKFPAAWKPSAGVASSLRKVSAQKWAVLAADMATIGGPDAGAIELAADGSFTTTIVVDKAAADTAAAAVATAVNYGIYTYPGSGAAQPLYETYTPVTFSAAEGTATATVDTAPTQVADGAATLTVADADGTAAAGSVSWALSNAADVEVASGDAALTGGAAQVVLPKQGAGDYTLTASYDGAENGNANITTAIATAPVAIAKATSTTAVQVTKVPTASATGAATITVDGAVDGVVPTGDVQAQLRSSTGAILATTSAQVDANGRATVTLPKRTAGTYTLVATYVGDGNVAGSSKTVSVTVAKVAATVRGTWTRKPTGARAGGLRVVVTAPGVKPTGLVTVTVRNARGKAVRTVRVRLNAAGAATAALPRLAKGRYTVSAAYAGNTQATARTWTLRFTTTRR